MQAASHSSTPFPTSPIMPTSLGDRLTDLVFAPAGLFQGLASTAVRPEHWLAPLFFSSLTQVLAAALSSDSSPKDAWLDSAAILLVCQFLGTLWAAFIFWAIGTFFLKATFRYHKALELVGLVQLILCLSTLAALVLVIVTGDPTAKPALSLFFRSAAPGPGTTAFLNAFNPFHLWMASVLSLALSKLAAVTFPEAAFWIFGYWIGGPLMLALL